VTCPVLGCIRDERLVADALFGLVILVSSESNESNYLICLTSLMSVYKMRGRLNTKLCFVNSSSHLLSENSCG